jgi:predicted RND superfamily exporter protein
MERLARFLIRFRIAVLVVVAAITVLLGAMIPRLTADDDVMKFLPQADPQLVLFNKVNERFGGLDVAILGIESDDLFTVERLERVRALTRAVAAVDGVFDVMSFTEVPDAQPAPGGGLRVEPLVVEKLPHDPEELAALKARVLANDNAVGNMISADGKAAMILCFLGGKRPPIHVAADIKETARRLWADEPLYFGGAPFIRLHVAGGTKEDLRRLTPVVVVVVLLVTFLIFRKPVGVVLALGTVGIALAWLMGILALRSKGLNLVESALPTLLVAIGGAYGIHLLSAYFSGTARTVPERIAEAYREVGAPVVASAATTCAGFLSFLVMDVEPMRDFGLYAALGVGLTAILALALVPVALSFSREVPKSLGATPLARPLGRIGAFAARHRAGSLAAAGALAVAGALGVLRIAPDATLKTFFAEGSEPDRANAFLERRFGGSVYLQIYFEGDMRSPFVLSQLRKVVEHARGMEEVVQVNSIIDPLTMLGEAMGWRADLPVSNRQTEGLYPFLEGTAAIDQMVSPDKTASLVQIRLRDVGPERINAAVAELNAVVRDEIPRGVRAIKLGPFTDPEQALEYRDYRPELVADDAADGFALVEPADDAERRIRLATMRREIARRVIRLARIPGGAAARYDKAAAVEEILAGPGATGDLAAGPDLDAALAGLVEEHLSGDSAWFEEPDEERAAPEEIAEWEQRSSRVAARLGPLAGTFVDSGRLEGILGELLPNVSRRDPEGLAGTARALAAGLAETRAHVRAGRLTEPALAAAGLHAANPAWADADLRAAVSGALSDLDVPVHGFPDTRTNAATILARVTGMPVINVAFCQSTIRNQLASLALAAVVLLVVLAVTFRSVISAVKALAPALFMLSVAAGLMGAAEIPLDPTTSMIAAIALGIGVDYAIHFLWRRRRRGESLGRTTAQVGPSIASNALQVAAGFAVLALSDMIPMQRFGLLVALTMILSAMATFVLLPALRAEGAEAEQEQEAGAGTMATPR